MEREAQALLKTKHRLDIIHQQLLLFNCLVFMELFKILRIKVHAKHAQPEIIALIRKEQLLYNVRKVNIAKQGL